MLELIKAVLRREPASLTRAVVGVGAGILGAAASIGVVEALLAATDALCDGIVHTTGLGSIAHLGSKIAPAAALTSLASPALMLILGLGYVVASFFVWAVFIVRKAMIIVAAVFAPVAFAGAAAHATSGWVRKWVEFTAGDGVLQAGRWSSCSPSPCRWSARRGRGWRRSGRCSPGWR